MLYDLLYDQIRNIILGFESIYQIIRESKAEIQVNTNTKKRSPRNNFREFVKDKKKTEEIIKKLSEKFNQLGLMKLLYCK